jgi:hypothetical protein
MTVHPAYSARVVPKREGMWLTPCESSDTLPPTIFSPLLLRTINE